MGTGEEIDFRFYFAEGVSWYKILGFAFIFPPPVRCRIWLRSSGDNI